MKPSVEYRIAALLEKKNIKVSTAESCTGGLVAAALVNVAGISNWFEEGYVTYSNTAKQKLLGVDKDTLEQFGAVSEQTARQMAIGAAKAAGCQVCGGMPMLVWQAAAAQEIWYGKTFTKEQVAQVLAEMEEILA